MPQPSFALRLSNSFFVANSLSIRPSMAVKRASRAARPAAVSDDLLMHVTP